MNSNADGAPAASRARPAGPFLPWLEATRRGQRGPGAGADVPCGDCTACCRSAQFVHIRPEETRTLRRIPKALLFPAPGLPRGNVLMGYDERGHCPMLVDGRCSIYADRPQTCRDFDCRVFAATGLEPDPGGPQAAIAERAREWRFDLPDAESRRQHAAVRAAGAFLRHQRDRFPPGTLPGNPVQLAALAVEVYEIFAERAQARDGARDGGEAGPRDSAEAGAGAVEHRTDAEVARAVLAALGRDAGPENAEAAPDNHGGR